MAQMETRTERKQMIHKLCDKCGKTESVDFMVRLDDDYYCTECDEEMEKEMQKEDESNRIAWLARQKENNEKENDK